MPDRIIRDELLESRRFCSLKDNADRLAYISLLLKADALGNFSAEPYRLMRLWRDFGINTEALVLKSLTELVDADLVRLYKAEGRELLHIPRYNQSLRFISRIFPVSPWTTNEQKQRLKEKSLGEHTVSTPSAPDEVKRSDVTTPTPKPPPDPLNNATWLAYSTAYSSRYRVPPVRNASVNTCISNIVKRLGMEAPEVAAFYLTHNDQFYVKKRHSVKMLLADAEGLRTQWKTGNKATALEARSAETRDGLHEQYKRLIGENNA